MHLGTSAPSVKPFRTQTLFRVVGFSPEREWRDAIGIQSDAFRHLPFATVLRNALFSGIWRRVRDVSEGRG
ncbi:protein of unknown function [Hyphomicrobium sp. MC1]|nr:protein of unknown function [Hyphomicrobium sp. MC1]